MFDVLDSDGDMMEHFIPEFIHPAWNDAGLASFIRVGLVNEEGWIAGFAVDLGVPIVILQCFVVGVAQPDKWFGSTVDVECPDGDMINDRGEAYTCFIEHRLQNTRRAVVLNIILDHFPRELIECLSMIHGSPSSMNRT